MSFEVRFLKAGSGDAILVRFKGNDGKFHNILVDGGEGGVAQDNLIPEVMSLIGKGKKEILDAIFITHSDDDHLQGIRQLFKELETKSLVNKVGMVYFNSLGLIYKNLIKKRTSKINDHFTQSSETKLSTKNYFEFEKEMKRLKINMYNEVLLAGSKLNIKGMSLTLLSPNANALKKYWNKKISGSLKEKVTNLSGGLQDYSKDIRKMLKTEIKTKNTTQYVNNTSIALMLEYKKKTFLLTSDSQPKRLIESLQALKFDDNNKIKLQGFQLPHHGSIANINGDLLNMIECKKFYFSADGKSHPDKKCIALIFQKKENQPLHFYSNYNIWEDVFSKSEQGFINSKNILLFSKADN